ncbi:MAG: PD-(D/E)XK nuclease family protein [Anaerolineales bacterium]
MQPAEPRKLPLTTLSQSSLQDYADCPRRFQLRYLERLEYPAIESEPALENEKHQQEGERFHRLVQQYLVGIPAEKIAPLTNTPNLSRWWDNFHANFPHPAPSPALRPEITLSAPQGAFRLVAKYDLIARQDDGWMIYDWKTYRRRPRNESLVARLQTRVYRALLVQSGAHLNGGAPIPPNQVSMTYWFAEFPAEPAIFRYDAGQYQRDWAALEKLAAEIAAARDFPPTPDERHCAYCPYRSYCNRGITAGTGEEIESELELRDITLEQVQEIAF